MLYPVYLVVQAGLSAGRQLSSAARVGLPQLKVFTQPQHPEQPLVADTPIQRVLSEVSTLELQVERLQEELPPGRLDGWTVGRSNLLTYQPTKEQSTNLQPATQNHPEQIAQESNEGWVIHGVATLLATRTLVLVTIHNQILDILTPQQQQKLSAKIRWEVAHLLRYRRLVQASHGQVIRRRLSTLDRPRVVLPMRLFWQLMAWVQTSPIAIAANLFQETNLICGRESSVGTLEAESPNLQPSNLSTFRPPTLPTAIPVAGTLAFLDRTVAELETHQLVPGSEVAIALYELAALAVRERTQKLLQPLQTKFMTPGRQAESLETSQRNTFGIQALIYAAIDYFFGTPHSSNLKEADRRSGNDLTSQAPVALPPDLALSDASERDPWITWSDLFGNSEGRGLTGTATNSQPSSVRGTGKKSKIQSSKVPTQLPESFKGKTPLVPGHSLWYNVKRYLNAKLPPGELSVPSTSQPPVKPQKSIVRSAKCQTQELARGTTPKKLQPPSPKASGFRRTSISPATTATTTLATSSSDTHLEPAPDWIETQATPTGYVKHPLEQLLESLDRVMLWLEELIVKAWRWVKQLGTRG